MYSGSGVAVAAPDEKLCPRTLSLGYIYDIKFILLDSAPIYALFFSPHYRFLDY